MDIKLESERTFQLWEYHVSHGQALIRSPKSGPDQKENIDVLIFGIEYIAISRHLKGITIRRPHPNKIEDLKDSLPKSTDINRQNTWTFLSEGVRHYTIATGGIKVQTSNMGIFETPLEK